jgi:uncharacterized membrane protein SpoIIM required for sporulation
LAVFLYSIAITVAGALTPLNAKDSQDYDNLLEQEAQSLKSMTLWQSALSIFENNFLICLIMFIPVAGQIFGSITLYNTGLAGQGFANVHHVSSVLAFFLAFISPSTWLEFIAYSTAMASSLWLVWRTIRGEGKRELKKTGMFIIICGALLLLAAIIEASLVLLLAQS